jgi:hypothetical protein
MNDDQSLKMSSLLRVLSEGQDEARQLLLHSNEQLQTAVHMVASGSSRMSVSDSPRSEVSQLTSTR